MSQATAVVARPEPKPLEAVLQSLLRLPQLVKIHQPNNKILKENLEVFRKALGQMWEENSETVIRSHRGRLFLNNSKYNPAQAMTVTVQKLMEFFEERKFYGFRLSKKDDLSNDDNVEFIKVVNQAKGRDDAPAFLDEALRSPSPPPS